ncbi:MAG: lysine exporter LysO family protein [Candidatus Promineifilaceae bacterium]|nr:lysine exporter LysO family protein [Candidatus Promineifilaceae bacterium]
MRSSLSLLLAFVAGLLTGRGRWLPEMILEADPASYALALLLLLVGVTIGGSKETGSLVREAPRRILLLPALVVAGTLLSVALVSPLLPSLSLREALAVGAGFGYYSLSSVIAGQMGGATLGVLALLTNLMRELLTLLLAPLLARYLGGVAPIASGGATSMDTALPIISHFSGQEYAVTAIFSGIVLTVLAPLLITLFLSAGS